MEAREQMARLIQLQKLALDIRHAREVIDGAPDRIEEIESRFRDRNAEYVVVKDRFEELEADQRERSGELTELEATKKKYMESLMQVTNQREYAAMLKEIDQVKAKISEHEEAILKDMEECESLKPQLDSHAEHINEERVKVEAERKEVEALVEKSREDLARCEAERGRIESEIPVELLKNLRRIENSRQGIFLAKVEDGMCQACYVRVRPQVFQEIKLAAKIHNCGQCRRFLFFESPLAKQNGPEPSEKPGAEAANGSSV